MSNLQPPPSGFSEKAFYLDEFRGRALGLALGGPIDSAAVAAIGSVLRDLAANGTRTVLIGCEAPALAALGARTVVDGWARGGGGAVGGGLQRGGAAGLIVGDSAELARSACQVALRLRLAKLVWLDALGGLQRAGGGRLSHVDRGGLDEWIRSLPERADLLRELGAAIDGGLPSAAICEPRSLGDELFTYAGAGTFLTRDRYIEVRSLAIDEFERAHDLIARGVAEGYLVARDEDQLQEVLANAFGVFVERRYLAGIGALIPHREAQAGELGSFYTLTRFAGGGVGGHLVAHACDEALASGFGYVYACTTRPRVVRFFEAQGFREVGPGAIPAEKWTGYPPDRRAEVTCLRRDL